MFVPLVAELALLALRALLASLSRVGFRALQHSIHCVILVRLVLLRRCRSRALALAARRVAVLGLLGCLLLLLELQMRLSLRFGHLRESCVARHAVCCDVGRIVGAAIQVQLVSEQRFNALQQLDIVLRDE